MTESSLFISLPTGEASLAVGFWLPSLWERGWGRGLYSGPNPIQLVVVMAVRNAVSAATTIFTAISISRAFFIIVNYPLSIVNYQLPVRAPAGSLPPCRRQSSPELP